MNELFEYLKIFFNSGSFWSFFGLVCSIYFLYSFGRTLEKYFGVEKSKKEIKPNSVLKPFDKRKVSLKKSDESLPTDK